MKNLAFLVALVAVAFTTHVKATVTVVDNYNMGEDDSSLDSMGNTDAPPLTGEVVYGTHNSGTDGDGAGGANILFSNNFSSTYVNGIAKNSSLAIGLGAGDFLGGPSNATAPGIAPGSTGVTDNFGVEATVNVSSVQNQDFLYFGGDSGAASTGYGIVAHTGGTNTDPDSTVYLSVLYGLTQYYISDIPLVAGTTYDIAAVRAQGPTDAAGAGTLSLYVNGVDAPLNLFFGAGSADTTATPVSPNGDVQIGQGVAGTTIDNARFFTFAQGAFDPTKDLETPEPSTWALMLGGVAGLFGWMKFGRNARTRNESVG